MTLLFHRRKIEGRAYWRILSHFFLRNSEPLAAMYWTILRQFTKYTVGLSYAYAYANAVSVANRIVPTKLQYYLPISTVLLSQVAFLSLLFLFEVIIIIIVVVVVVIVRVSITAKRTRIQKGRDSKSVAWLQPLSPLQVASSRHGHCYYDVLSTSMVKQAFSGENTTIKQNISSEKKTILSFH